MNLLRRMLPVVAMVALLAFALPTRTLAATTYQFHVTGYTAQAYFSSWAGSTVTEAYLASGQKVGGTGNVTPYTLVYADEIDFSTNVPTLIAAYYGFVSTSTLQTDPKLTAASLAGDVPVQDMNGNPATLSLNLTWTGTGSLVRGVFNGHVQGQGFTVNNHFNGTTRAAQATGSISDGTINFAVGTSQYADLNHLTSGTMAMTH